MGKLGLGLSALALSGAIVVTCATINDKDKQNNELKESNTQLEFTINNQKDELLSKEIELEKLNKSLTAAKSDITNLQYQLDSTIAEKTQLQADLSSRDNQLALLNQSISEKETEISNLNNTIATKNTELETLQTNYDNLQDTSSAEKTALQNQISEKQTEIENLNLQLTEKQTELNNIIEQKATLENEKATLQEKLDSIYSKVEELYSEWNMTLPEGTELAETRDAQIVQKANAIAEYIDSQSSQISELQTQVASLTEQVNTLQTTNEDLNNQITTLNSRISSLTNSVSSWRNRYYQQRDLYNEILKNQPQLGAPTIVNNAGVITVSDPNGIFGGEYNVMLNTDYGIVAAANAPEFTKTEDGTYTFSISELGHLGTTSSVYVVAKGSGFKDSEKSNDVAITVDSVQFDAPVLTSIDTSVSTLGKITWEQVTTNEEPCRKYTYSVFAIGDEDTVITSGTLTDVFEFSFADLKTLESGNYCFKLQCSAVTNFTASEYSNKVRLEVVKNSKVRLMGFDAPEIVRNGNIVSWAPVITDGVECTNYKYSISNVNYYNSVVANGDIQSTSIDLSTLVSNYAGKKLSITIYCEKPEGFGYSKNNMLYYYRLPIYDAFYTEDRVLCCRLSTNTKQIVSGPVTYYIYNADTNELLKTAVVTGDETVRVDMSDVCPYNQSLNYAVKLTSEGLVDSELYNYKFLPRTEFSGVSATIEGRVLTITDIYNLSIPNTYYKIVDGETFELIKTVYSRGSYDFSDIIPNNISKKISIRVYSDGLSWIHYDNRFTFDAIEESQLNAPTISITDRTLTITAPTAAGESAVETEGMQFMIFDSATNKLLKTTTETTVDCSDICAADASITVYVIASLVGYADSVKSNAFSFDIGGDTGLIDDKLYSQFD